LKRIVLIGTALAGLFTAGITTVASAAASTTKSVTKYVTVYESKATTVTKTVPVSATCKLNLTTVAPAGTTGVTPGSPTGVNFGGTSCGSPLASGISREQYTLQTSGDITGTIQHWFKTGTVYGTFTLTESAPTGPPTTTSFGAAAYTGTVKITGAGGALKGTTGTASLTCQTNDALHYACTEKLKLSQTVKVTTISKVPVREKVVVRV
jgi:hypothetical protein